MRRFLVVGCGGSGGATLAFIMDQLRSELHAAGIDKLLGGWQFVQIDVPSAPETGPEGLANVPAQGGTYIGCGPQGSSYAILDGALSQRLAAESALDTIATWAPRHPQEVSIPISAGAGQYRAIGRMITLSKTTEIHNRVQAADPGLRTRPEADGRVHGDARHLRFTAAKLCHRGPRQFTGHARRDRGQ